MVLDWEFCSTMARILAGVIEVEVELSLVMRLAGVLAGVMLVLSLLGACLAGVAGVVSTLERGRLLYSSLEVAPFFFNIVFHRFKDQCRVSLREVPPQAVHHGRANRADTEVRFARSARPCDFLPGTLVEKFSHGIGDAVPPVASVVLANIFHLFSQLKQEPRRVLTL